MLLLVYVKLCFTRLLFITPLSRDIQLNGSIAEEKVPKWFCCLKNKNYEWIKPVQVGTDLGGDRRNSDYKVQNLILI